MSDTNEDIVDRVMHSLRDTAPPEGMETRILSAVQHRAAATPLPSRSRWRIASLAGSVALAGIVCALFFTTHPKPPQAAFPQPQAVTMRAEAVPVVPPIAATWKPPKPPLRRARLITASSTQEKALAVVSYPAPPMPLTEQEKLLLRIVHQGDPVQIAMLDPVQRATRSAAEKAEFQQFFDLPMTGENK